MLFFALFYVNASNGFEEHSERTPRATHRLIGNGKLPSNVFWTS